MDKKKRNRYKTQMLISRGLLVFSVLVLVAVIWFGVGLLQKGGGSSINENTASSDAESTAQEADSQQSFDKNTGGENEPDGDAGELADASKGTAADDQTGESSNQNGAEDKAAGQEAGASDANETGEETEAATETIKETDSESAVDQNEEKAKTLLQGMSLEEKLYQMFCITPEQLTSYQIVTAAGDTSKAAYEKKPVGGLIYFAQNLKSPDQTKEMLENMQKYAVEKTGVPVFLAVDEEGGRVARVGENASFQTEKIEPMNTLESAEQAGMAGETIGKYLSELGFNLDFAPDADVLTNPDNKVIGDRSFGDDPQQVTEFAKAYSDGLHKSGILSCYKHFPGHGATKGDTHVGLAYTDKTLEQLKQSELIPFQNAQKDGADFVMVAHISVPSILDENTPCSVSEKMITDVLRNDCGYEGVIITDAMNMGAVTGQYGAAKAAVMAVSAGVDMILMPQDFNSAYQALSQAVESGEIKEEQIDASVRRILLAKLRIGN